MIGIFDSGSGGLSVLKVLREKDKKSDIIYFGDIKNIPYGNKSREEIEHLTMEGMKLLHDRGATHIINACNSMSASLLLSTLRILDIDPNSVTEMVAPTVSSMSKVAGNTPISLIATKATVESEAYQAGFRMIGREIRAYANSDLVEAIESGAAHDTIYEIIERDIKEISRDGCGKLILGCTHYPLVKDIFEQALKQNGLDNIELIDPAEFVVANFMENHQVESRKGKTEFILSKKSQFFSDKAKELGLGFRALFRILP